MSVPRSPQSSISSHTTHDAEITECEKVPTDAVSIDETDFANRRGSEEGVNEGSNEIEPTTSLTSRRSLEIVRKVTSVGTTGTTDPNFEVDWEDENDPENPRNWSILYRGICIAILSWNTLAIVIYSTSYTAGIPEIASVFNTSETIVTLGLTFYLLGLAFGSLLLAPLSEIYGRKPVTIASLALFTLMVIPSALATSITEILVTRFISAFAGSVMVSSAPGMVADLVDDEHRAMAFSIWSIGPINGPVFGPILGGFVIKYLGWRWNNWISLIFGGSAVLLAAIMRETYAPALLRKKAAKIRETTGQSRWWSRYDHKASLKEVMKTNLSRPFVMAVVEPICIFWNVYISLVYAVLYLCFVAYPIVFGQIRGWEVDFTGLAFLGIGTGCLIIVSLEPVIRRMINNHKIDPSTGKVPPEALVSMVCIGSILVPVGELWFAWTCAPASIHWILPILAGIPFGAGNTAVFIYSSTYLTHSYGIYAASALAGNSVIRSILGGVLPLAGNAMYSRLGANWASTLLGLLEVAIVPIPFVFYKYGHKIRQKSDFISAMQVDKEKLDGKRLRRRPEQQPEMPPDIETADHSDRREALAEDKDIGDNIV